MTYFLLITAFTVSIDSFLCGFALSFSSGRKIFLVLIITLTVFITCVIANYAAVFLNGLLTEKIASLGGIILILLGIYGLIKKDTPKVNGSAGIIKQSIIAGFAVGLDGAFANLSLSLMGYDSVFVPLTIAIMHGVMISFGILLAKTGAKIKGKAIKFLPPLILISLGVYKLIGFFT